MAVTAKTAGLGMTGTGVISPVLWNAGVRVEAIVTLMAFQPHFWKIWELMDPFTQGKWPILFWKFEQILPGILFQFLQPRNMDTKRELFLKIPIFWAWADRLGKKFFGHLGYFRPNYNTHLGSVTPLSMVLIIWLFFLQKTFGFQAWKIQIPNMILAVKNLQSSLHTFIVCACNVAEIFLGFFQT